MAQRRGHASVDYDRPESYEAPEPIADGWRPDPERWESTDDTSYELDRDYVEGTWGMRELAPAWGWGPFEQSTRGYPRRHGMLGRGADWGYDEESVVVRPGPNDDPVMPLASEYRGPRGYRRSPERIREDVCEAMTEHPMLDCRDIEVAVEDDQVILTGTIPERRLKWLAEDIAADVRGVGEVLNQLRLRRESRP